MDLAALDRLLFRDVYDAPLPRIPAELVTHVATRGGVWLVTGILLAVLGTGRHRRTGLALCAGLVAHVLLIETLLKEAVARERPYLALGLELRDTFLREESFSFPSGHSAASFLAAWVLGATYPRLRKPLLALAALVAVSRVHLGAHWPSDVAAGAFAGLALGVVLVRLFRLGTPPAAADAAAPPPAPLPL